MLGALLAPAFQALGKAMGFGSDNANKLKKSFSSVNEMLESFEEKLANSRSSLANLNTTSTANLDALNAQSAALVDMVDGLEQLRINAIAFRATGSGFAKFFDENMFNPFDRDKIEEAADTTRQALAKMSTDFTNLNEETQKLFEENMNPAGFELLQKQAKGLLATENLIANLREKQRKEEIEFNKKQNVSNDEAEDHARLMDSLTNSIKAQETKRATLQGEIQESTVENLDSTNAILNAVGGIAEGLRRGKEAGLSLKSALDGAKEASSAFNRQFIKKLK